MQFCCIAESMIRTCVKDADFQERATGCRSRVALIRISVLHSGAIKFDDHSGTGFCGPTGAYGGGVGMFVI
jgi:hypothetical protein